ncbi:RNA polymerase recycling motor HelD [Oceanobacillus halophilus]|uniref:Helicase n=1 Tax=Oceanobacillus halophilus TaxID=930130 RepID=A0A494ZZX2_9BACI|nr:RNA polymerase recycling motor HelD [Oceanobacillus halophilus]RKQ30779.1 helicase [Oceanobacillus halophilus]
MNQKSENQTESLTKDRLEEEHRVKYVHSVIDEKQKTIKTKTSGLKESIVDLRKDFWDDVTVNLDEPDDVIETQASLKQQAEFLAERERSHGKMDQERKTLERLKSSPYFGRIDFQETSEDEVDKIYIGVSSLMDKDQENFLIYDWRAPISSMYYDYGPGPAQYKTTEETITGEISLKRQFIIRQGKLKGMFDTGVTIGDELLQQALGNNASTTMQSIVATIQKEQNKIIRNEKSNLLIVQGVAGSGKTSAALQRIAYLMYRFREELNANNLHLFSPNPLFSNYIANVLPELGEANINQSTFLEFLRKRIEKYMEIESPFEQMEFTLTEKNADDYSIRLRNMDYKSSLRFKTMLDDFISDLKNDGIRFKNIKFRDQILISKEEIYDYFYSIDVNIDLPNKMELVAKWLLTEIRRHQKKEIYKDWVMEEAELLEKEDYQDAFFKSQDMYGDEDDPMLEEAYLRKEVIKRAFAPIKKRIKHLKFVNILGTYRSLFEIWTPKNKPSDWEDICQFTVYQLAHRYLTWEDATPYLYFKGRLLGDDADRSIRHLFIDEAQDYSAFQFAFIRHIFPYTRMTLLGDINQGIYAYTTSENPLIPEAIPVNHERLTLTKSYRSTKPIVEFSRQFAPGQATIEAFEREGEKPKLIKTKEDADLTAILTTEINKQKNNGHETIAIICKTLAESNRMYHLLQDKHTIYQINEETYAFEKGLLVLPVYLAKGIEFDAVILPEASKQQYSDESDRALFYTACTRAMHDLTMISAGEPCMFINEASKETYEIN